jgi:hypothetical protein
MSEIKKLRPITAAELSANGVVALADRPNARGAYGQGGFSAADLKKWFDKLSGFLATKINDLQNVLASPEAADYIALEKAYDEVRTLGDLIRSLESGIFASTILHAQLPGFIDSNTVLQNVLNRIAAECKEKTMVSLFDGIGGFPLCWKRAGGETLWVSEIEEFCIAVTKKRFGEEETK